MGVYVSRTWEDSPSEATPINAAALQHYEDFLEDLGVLETFSPTINNVTVGNGSVEAKYTRIGGLVFVMLKVVLGSTSSVSGDISFSLPVTAAGTLQTIAQSVILLDASAGNLPGLAILGSTTSCVVRPVVASGAYSIANAAINGTTPFTWTSTDTISVGLVYVAA